MSEDKKMVEYLTPDEAAVIFRVFPGTVYRWLRAKKLKGRKIGGIWRIPSHQVRVKMEERKK